MNKNVNSPKDINEYKIVVPMSNEAVNKIKSNITKSILGISIAGVMIAGATTQVKAETVENPTAIVQEAKEEVRTQYDQEIASILKSNSSKDEEAVTLLSARETSADENSTEVEEQNDSTDQAEKSDGLDALINYEGIKKLYNEESASQPTENSEENQIELSEEKTHEAKGAGENAAEEYKNLQKATDSSYANDEKNVG